MNYQLQHKPKELRISHIPPRIYFWIGTQRDTNNHHNEDKSSNFIRSFFHLKDKK